MNAAARSLAAVATIMLLIAFLYAAVAAFAFSSDHYMQTPPYNTMADTLVEYLTGRQATLPDALFTQRERLHMEDVYWLFAGAKRVAAVCLAGGIVLCAVSWFLGGRRRMGRGMLIGIVLFAGIALAVGLWAALDFDGWFRRMHEIVFTNDLWLLDPAESMLIRMMPLDFFMDAVRTIAIHFGLMALGLAAIALLCGRPYGKKEIR